MKDYVISVKTDKTTLSIGAYLDAAPRIFRIYSNGSDIGLRYKTIGHASRFIQNIAEDWKNRFGTEFTYGYGNPLTIPIISSSDWNETMYRAYYEKRCK